MTVPLLAAAQRLRDDVARLKFSPPVAYVYNPLEYSWAPFRMYIERYGQTTGRAILLGMNPGPFGMAQTGVPFGEISLVRDWLGIEAPVGCPDRMHPKRPVLGFACSRSEVSGRRLWGWARDAFQTPERFFARYFILNYCPLLFLEESGRNLTPDKLRPAECSSLIQTCDAFLEAALTALQPSHLIGVGAFAEKCLARVAPGREVLRIPHPSPANPSANSNWTGMIEKVLDCHGLPVAWS